MRSHNIRYWKMTSGKFQSLVALHSIDFPKISGSLRESIFKVYRNFRTFSVYRKFPLNSRIDVVRYEPHIFSLRSFNFFSKEFHWFLQWPSCFGIKCYEKESIMAVVLKFVRNVYIFSDVLHEKKQKTQTNSRECAVWTGNLAILVHQWFIIISLGFFHLIKLLCSGFL